MARIQLAPSNQSHCAQCFRSVALYEPRFERMRWQEGAAPQRRWYCLSCGVTADTPAFARALREFHGVLDDRSAWELAVQKAQGTFETPAPPDTEPAFAPLRKEERPGSEVLLVVDHVERVERAFAALSPGLEEDAVLPSSRRRYRLHPLTQERLYRSSDVLQSRFHGALLLLPLERLWDAQLLSLLVWLRCSGLAGPLCALLGAKNKEQHEQREQALRNELFRAGFDGDATTIVRLHSLHTEELRTIAERFDEVFPEVRPPQKTSIELAVDTFERAVSYEAGPGASTALKALRRRFERASSIPAELRERAALAAMELLEKPVEQTLVREFLMQHPHPSLRERYLASVLEQASRRTKPKPETWWQARLLVRLQIPELNNALWKLIEASVDPRKTELTPAQLQVLGELLWESRDASLLDTCRAFVAQHRKEQEAQAQVLIAQSLIGLWSRNK